MPIQYGDVLLNNDTDIYGTSGGDLAGGDNKEHQIGAIINASAGNFRRHPTLGANLVQDLDGPLNSRQVTSKIQDAVFLDGWELRDLSIDSEGEETKISVLDAVKVTDDTESLI